MATDELVRDGINTVFEGAVSTVERPPDGGWDARLWEALQSSGLTTVSIPEEQGGSGGSYGDLAEVFLAAGRHAAAVPIVEAATACWLMAESTTLRKALTSIAFFTPERDQLQLRHAGQDARASGVIRDVAWGRHVDAVIIVGIPTDEGARHALAWTEHTNVIAGQNVASEPRDVLELEDAPVELLAADSSPREIGVRVAAGRALASVGGLERVLDLSITYAKEREQFGRPIGRFQAVQHLVTMIAGTTNMCRAMADYVIELTPKDERFELGVAALCTLLGDRLWDPILAAHQVHGAMGFTNEHELHRYTTRLMAWRDEFALDQEWAHRLGHYIASNGAPRLWELVTGVPSQAGEHGPRS